MNLDSLPNNVYYDANIINDDTSGTKNPPQLVFQDIRSTSILTSPQNYELSVVRFNLQTANSLPLWIPSIQLNQVNFDPNLTSYSFNLVYNHLGVNYNSGRVFVRYIPCDYSATIPIQATSMQDVYASSYYYVKSFNTIVDMFNNALTVAFVLLQQTVERSGVTLPSENAPFFEWDSETSKFILNADVIGYDSNELDHISILCGSALYSLLSGFQGDYFGVRATEGNYCFKIKKELRSLNLFTVSDTYSVIQLYQEYSSASLFTPISSIVFTTSMMPVLPTNSTQPTIFNGQGGLTNSGNNNNITSMITDFQSQDNQGYGFSGSLSYIPSAEYRFISMNQGSEKINNIDLIVYWKDTYAHLHPLLLMPGCSCSIKILFRKIKNL